MVGSRWPGRLGKQPGGWAMAADVVAGETGPAEFGILGPLEVSRSGCMMPLGGPRQRAVLALLVLEANRVVSMDRLAEDIWVAIHPTGGSRPCRPTCFTCARRLIRTGPRPRSELPA